MNVTNTSHTSHTDFEDAFLCKVKILDSIVALLHTKLIIM